MLADVIKRSNPQQAEREDYVPFVTLAPDADLAGVGLEGVAKFRAVKINKGGTKTLCDRRVSWASELREIADRLSGGERKARARFWRRLADRNHPRDPVAALTYALGLDYGPIPDLQTREEFDRQWNREKVARIAARWERSPLTPHFAQAQMRKTGDSLLADAPEDAEILRTIARDQNAPAGARIAAAKARLDLVAKMVGEPIEGFTIPALIPENWHAVQHAQLEIAATMKDTERAKVVIGLLGNWLAVNQPVPKPGTGAREIRFVRSEPAHQPQPEVEIPPPPPPPSVGEGLLQDEPPQIEDHADDVDAIIGEIIPTTAEVVG